MMKRKIALLAMLLGLLAPALYGCGEQFLVAKPGLVIEIRDARTGAPAAYHATVTVRDGAFMENRHGHAGAPPEYEKEISEVWAAENRAGIYEVTIAHPQYQTWSRSGVRVRWINERNPFSGSRMPEQVRIVAELEPLEQR